MQRTDRSPARRFWASKVESGSIYSTPHDLFRIVQALLGGAYGPDAKGSLARWGPAAVLQEGDSITWGGPVGSYSAFVTHDPATDLTVLFTGNLLTGEG